MVGRFEEDREPGVDAGEEEGEGGAEGLQQALVDPRGGAEEDCGDAAERAAPVQLEGLFQQVQQHSLALVGPHLREQQQQSALNLVAFFQSFPGDFTSAIHVQLEVLPFTRNTGHPEYSYVNFFCPKSMFRLIYDKFMITYCCSSQPSHRSTAILLTRASGPRPNKRRR